MAIKWSAIKVSEVIDKLEHQVLLADQFIAEARAKVEAAKKIPNLPQYIEQRFFRLTDQLNRMEYIKEAIETIRKDIPDGAIEAERERGKYGSSQPLI